MNTGEHNFQSLLIVLYEGCSKSSCQIFTERLIIHPEPTIATSLAIGSDPADAGALRLDNGAAIAWEDATELSLTHVDNTGLLLNSTHQLQFGDSGTYIAQLNDGHLDLTADTSIDLNGAVTIPANAATITHSGTTSLTIASTSGYVAAESVRFSGGDITYADSIAPNGAADFDIGGASTTDVTIVTDGGSIREPEARIHD